MRRYGLICLSWLWLVGCAHNAEIVPAGDGRWAPRLQRERVVYIALPDDGRFGVRAYQFSPKLVGNLIQNAFARQIHRIEVSDHIEQLDPALNRARRLGAGYLVYPEVLTWEHKSYAWNINTKLSELKLQVYDVETRELLDAIIIEGGALTSHTGTDNPRAMLPDSLKFYVESLYTGRPLRYPTVDATRDSPPGD